MAAMEFTALRKVLLGVEDPEVPSWCRHWPKNYETSGDFDWEKEFNF